MERSFLIWFTVVCAVVFWVGAPMTQAGEICRKAGIRECDSTGELIYRTFNVLNATEFNHVCDRKGSFSRCFGDYLDRCEAFDQMQMRKFIAKYNYLCKNRTTKAGFLAHRACITRITKSNTKNCPYPELFAEGDKLGNVDHDLVQRTRQCWEESVRDGCGRNASQMYDDYLSVIHEVVVDHYTVAVFEDGVCYDDAQFHCHPAVRKDFSEFLMSSRQIDDYCAQEQNITSCFNEKMPECETYDKMLIEKETKQLHYICEDQPAFLQHRVCLGGFFLRNDVNCSVLDIPEFGGQITREITEEEVNATKTCWMEAVQKYCPSAVSWYSEYEDIGYDLALTYSRGILNLASLATLLLALVIGKLVE